MSVRKLLATPLHALSHILAVSRLSLSLFHPYAVSQSLQRPFASVLPFYHGAAADEALAISNVSATRILEIDWSAIGGGTTISGYRYSLSPSGISFRNLVYISGRLSDGEVVLDMVLRKNRMERVVAEVNKLIALSAKSKSIS